MIKIKILSYLSKIALNKVINSVDMKFTTRILNKTLIINKVDLETATKILERNSIKFKIQ
jgi:hypothetical protein